MLLIISLVYHTGFKSPISLTTYHVRGQQGIFFGLLVVVLDMVISGIAG
jgi:hypothetical protein